MTFRCRARACQGTIEVAIVDTSGELLGCAISGDETKDRLEFLSIIFTAPETGTVTIELRSTKEVIGSVIEFGQMYSRPVLAIKDVKLPHGSRWQVDMPGTSAYWQGNELVLNAQAQPFLYLYRSYTVPTTLNEFIELAVQVTIENGALGIGVLSENGNEWLLCSRFESEHHATTIAFNTGNHVGFQVVLFALNAEPLRARIDWGNRLDVPPVHKKRTIDPKQLLLPVPTNWLVDSPGADVRWNGDQVRIIWSGPQRLYLLRSPRFPCPHLSSAMPKLSLHISVKSGCLCIGFLGGNTETFASLSYFGEGAHNATIEIDTRGQHSLMVVLYSNSPKPLDATIDWGKSVSLELQEEAQREWRGGSFDPRKVDSESTAQALIGLNDRQKNLDDFVDDQSNTPPLSELFVPPSISTRVTKTYMQAGVAGVIRKAAHSFLKKTIPTRVAQIYIDAGVVGLIGKALGYLTQRALPHSLTRGLGFNSLLKLCFPKAAIYCQKPWTDLNNFTVDGRMDVCCITTGPSQERYALGNIFKQDFQEIWNGERMKEFRRTVNTEDKLPPCARCPMANNYKPPF